VGRAVGSKRKPISAALAGPVSLRPAEQPGGHHRTRRLADRPERRLSLIAPLARAYARAVHSDSA
jgi:hypothetical protein